MTQQDGEDYLTPNEASAILGISSRTLDRYADDGLIQKYRRGIRKSVVYKRTDVDILYKKLNEIVPDQSEK